MGMSEKKTSPFRIGYLISVVCTEFANAFDKKYRLLLLATIIEPNSHVTIHGYKCDTPKGRRLQCLT